VEVQGSQPSESGKGVFELVETWEGLRARLYHLAYLGEELAEVVASGPVTSAWLYRVIAAEAGEVMRIAGEYITECGHHHGARQGGGAL
jgi:hypothetical protein